MGIGPGEGTHITALQLEAPLDGIETEEELLHRLASESKEPAIREALNDVYILVKLYHADDIADEKEENERFRRGMKERIRKILNQGKKSDLSKD